MTVQNFDQNNADGMLAKGVFRIEFTKSTSNTTKNLTFSTKDSAFKVGSSALLRLPAAFAKEVMMQAYSANSWVQKLTSNQLPGFSSVMGSRFVQFFIWPELMNYSKSAVFNFNVYSNKDIQVTGTGTKYQVKATLLSQMLAPQGKSYVPFMYFTLPFSSNIGLTVKSGTLSSAFTSTSLGMSYQWDPTYINKYLSNDRFDSSTIQSKIQNAISGQTMNVTLPTFPLSEGLDLKVQGASSVSNGDLELQLTP
jgi:hypothetical protein